MLKRQVKIFFGHNLTFKISLSNEFTIGKNYFLASGSKTFFEKSTFFVNLKLYCRDVCAKGYFRLSKIHWKHQFLFNLCDFGNTAQATQSMGRMIFFFLWVINLYKLKFLMCAMLNILEINLI